MVLLVVLSLLWAPAAFAQRKPAQRPVSKQSQPSPSPQAQWPIRSLAVEGNENYSKEQILAVAGLKLRQPAGKPQFDAARDRLMATGAFESIGYRYAPSADQKGYAVTFEVDEFEPAYPMIFEQLDLPDTELKEFLKTKDPLFGSKLPATTVVLDRYRKAIEEFLAAQGKPDKVVSRIVPTGPDQFAILFRSARPLPAVAEVKFQGNRAIPEATLQEAISSVAVGVPFTENRFRQMLNSSVRPLYEARGLIQVAFPEITTEKAKDVEGLRLTVAVDEGAKYELGGVTLEGNKDLTTEELMKAAQFKVGEVADFDQIGKSLERIRTEFRRQGFMHVDTSVERKIDDQKKTVDLVVHITEGPQFTFNKLNIEGLDIHGEAAIRRMWGLKEGKPFSSTYPEYFLSRVREDQIFENLKKTRSKIEVNEENRTVDVTLYFQ